MADGESNIAELPIGKAWTDRKAAVEAFKEKGLHTTKQVISDLRGGWMSGDVIKNRLVCSEKLSQDDASLKNNLYLDIAERALDLRSPQASNVNRYDTNRYMEALSQQLGKDQHDVARLLQAMRADLLSTNPDGTDPDLASKFLSLAERFIKDYSGGPPSKVHPPITNLSNDWNHTTIQDYYRALSRQGVRFVTTWVPYEMDVMAQFYGTQISQGNHLTPFDISTLKVILDPKISDIEAARQIKLETETPVNHAVVQFHRNSLVYGSPESALRTRASTAK